MRSVGRRRRLKQVSESSTLACLTALLRHAQHECSKAYAQPRLTAWQQLQAAQEEAGGSAQASRGRGRNEMDVSLGGDW